MTADNVVVAMASYQRPSVPAFAARARRPDHAAALGRVPQPRTAAGRRRCSWWAPATPPPRSPSRSAPHTRPGWQGETSAQIPFRIDGFLGRHLLVRLTLRGLFHRVLTVHTPMGRKVRAMSLGHGGPLIRTKRKGLAAAGVTLRRADGGRARRPSRARRRRTARRRNVIWCTGFHPGFDWIDLPIHGDHEPQHEQGVVPSQPGLYFVGLHFLSALSSTMIHGVGRDAERIARHLAARATAAARHSGEPAVAGVHHVAS